MTTQRSKAIRARQHHTRRSHLDNPERNLRADATCVTTGKARFGEAKATARAAEFGGTASICIFCGDWHHARGSYAAGTYGRRRSS